MTPFRKYGKHSTGTSTYGPWARTYSKLFSCKPVVTVCSYGAPVEWNLYVAYGRVSRGSVPRVRRYGLLYLRTVEYDHSLLEWSHDDVIKWTHFLRYWPFVRGIHRSPVNSPHKGQWHGALMFSLVCVWINDWVNSREAGDVRRYRTHYDVIVMCFCNAQLASDYGRSGARFN